MFNANNNDGAGASRNSVAVTARDLTPICDWSDMGESEHFVQFYENDDFLLTSLGGYVGMGLSMGDACVVVATRAHRESLDERLQGYGLDVFAARAFTQYIQLDAEETLAQMTVDGKVDAGRFAETVGGLVTRAAQGGRRVRIFGEMVALLWERGEADAAIRLEELWNDLGATHSFMLFCAYPMKACGGEALAGPVNGVCATHSRVIPAESYAGLASADERLRTIIRLQQKAQSLEAEVVEREEAEAALRAVTDELEVQVADLRRLHEMSVGLTGTLDIEALLAEVLRSAMAVHGTDMGLLSLRDSGRDGINVKVHSGFDEAFLKQVEWVPAGGGAYGTCFAERRRVIVEDTEVDPLFADYREAARGAGFRACHSTPLLTRDGNIIGTLSVHFRESRRPSEREVRLMDLYARMAADIIESARLHQRVQQELEERKQSLAREQKARAEAEAANRMKDQFLATVSHELRTPLNAIVGWVHMLRRGNLDAATTARAVETIERNARAQAQLVEDILDVSRVITGKLRLNVGAVDMAAVINAAIDAVQLAADSKNIGLGVTLDPSARHISGDASRLQQVVWNLLSNAIKFTPAGGRVEVGLERDGQSARIKVSDTGEGISREFLPFIFDRFRQADGTSTRRHGGLGLGLAIVRHLIEMHGGSVEADSPGEGCGATFTLKLPLMPARAGAAKERAGVGNLWPAEESDGRFKLLPALDDIQVLLVDDDPDTLQVLAAMLTECRAKVRTAGHAEEAMGLLGWYRPDVLVADLAMPGEDGYSLIRRVRALNEANGAQMPAVALTAYARVEDRAQALAAGFNVFVTKPVEPNELITAIAHLMEPRASRIGRA